VGAAVTPAGYRQAVAVEIPPFHVMRVLAAAAQRRARGQVVYDLSAGQPATPAPAAVRRAAHDALDRDRLAYTGAAGLLELRVAIAGHYAERYGLDVDPASVIATTGSSGGFLVSFLACFQPGDLVALARPGYPAYRNMLRALGCRIAEIDTGDRFALRASDLDALPERPAGVVLASPANPTGTMIAAGELAAIGRWCETNGVRLISDEIYHGITYSAAGATSWATGRHSIVVNSFSKYFSMTGWRLGWLLVPDELVDAVDRLAGNFALCPPTLAQHAAVHAFDSYVELDENVQRYKENRATLLRRLPEIGIDRIAPVDGAFYVYADVSRWTGDSLAWCDRVLDETGVAVAPGVDFDLVDGGRFVRLCFAGDSDELGRAVDVLGGWLARQPSVLTSTVK
jgi:aspartate/methionine/tyrosine aminotransferase